MHSGQTMAKINSKCVKVTHDLDLSYHCDSTIKISEKNSINASFTWCETVCICFDVKMNACFIKPRFDGNFVNFN